MFPNIGRVTPLNFLFFLLRLRGLKKYFLSTFSSGGDALFVNDFRIIFSELNFFDLKSFFDLFPIFSAFVKLFSRSRLFEDFDFENLKLKFLFLELEVLSESIFASLENFPDTQ